MYHNIYTVRLNIDLYALLKGQGFYPQIWVVFCEHAFNTQQFVLKMSTQSKHVLNSSLVQFSLARMRQQMYSLLRLTFPLKIEQLFRCRERKGTLLWARMFIPQETRRLTRRACRFGLDVRSLHSCRKRRSRRWKRPLKSRRQNALT